MEMNAAYYRLAIFFVGLFSACTAYFIWTLFMQSGSLSSSKCSVIFVSHTLISTWSRNINSDSENSPCVIRSCETVGRNGNMDMMRPLGIRVIGDRESNCAKQISNDIQESTLVISQVAENYMFSNCHYIQNMKKWVGLVSTRNKNIWPETAILFEDEFDLSRCQRFGQVINATGEPCVEVNEGKQNYVKLC
ncbi:unnamed protein product [Calicophoron daubneyi]|uniref:Uncharacterized protein n=1 Tax=Calicophoron daubneyi TaxID=300641 RepID=A0AAV2TEJ3_CALDB